jgi:choline kinase
LKSSSDVIHPITTSDAVIVTTDSGSDSLTNVLREIRVEVNDSKVILDERPTEGNTTHSVSSDGIFQELKETVGNIQILLQNV